METETEKSRVEKEKLELEKRKLELELQLLERKSSYSTQCVYEHLNNHKQ